MEGWVGVRKELNMGYWRRAKPTVAEEVQRGRMRPKWPALGWRAGIVALSFWLIGLVRDEIRLYL